MSLGFTSLFQGLIKRVVKPPISMAGGAIVTVASFIFGLFWDDNAHVALFVTQMVMQGVGTGWGGPEAMTTALSRVPDDLMSTFAGVMSLMFQVSAIIGMALCLTSVEFFGGVTEPAAFRATFVLALAIGVVGVGFAFAAMGIVLKSSPAGTWEKLEEGKSSGESEDSATDRDADVVVASPSDEEP
jgi:MFS family permease